jgi:hypothetical protein
LKGVKNKTIVATDIIPARITSALWIALLLSLSIVLVTIKKKAVTKRKKATPVGSDRIPATLFGD